MKISIVTTLYRSEPFLHEFYVRARAAVEEIACDYEMVFVNDGSPDGSLAIALELVAADPKIRIVDLSRNFGHHAAIMVGLRESTGDYVFFVDSDLEEPPENLVPFYQELQSNPDADVVYGSWQRHGEPLARRLAAEAYYTVVNFLSEVKVPRNLVLSRIMTRRYVDALLDAWVWPAAPAQLLTSIGFKQLERQIQRTYKGYSSYSWLDRARLTVNSITSFSARPLHYIFLTGMFIFLLSVFLTAYAVLAYIFLGDAVAGWYSVFISLWFIGGLAMMSIGVLGLYIARIFDQVRAKPLAIVRTRYASEGDDEAVADLNSRGRVT